VSLKPDPEVKKLLVQISELTSEIKRLNALVVVLQKRRYSLTPNRARRPFVLSPSDLDKGVPSARRHGGCRGNRETPQQVVRRRVI
jgi:hypothetical protein